MTHLRQITATILWYACSVSHEAHGAMFRTIVRVIKNRKTKCMPHTGALALPTSPVLTATTHDYTDLKKRIKQAGLLEKQPRSFIYTMTLTLLALLAGFLALFLVHNLWFQLVNALYLAVLLAQVGFLGHDTGHRQPFSSTRK